MIKRVNKNAKFPTGPGKCLLFSSLVLLFFSCAGGPEMYKDIDPAVNQSDFESGIEVIKKSQEGNRPIYPENNAVSLYLDKGLLEHYAGNYRNSSHDLQEAERLIQEAFTKSVSAGIASYIANDNAKEYPGEDYEDIYINVFNALNYYHDDNLEGAMVEVRKITMSSGKLDMLSRKYESRKKSASDWMTSQLNGIGFGSSPSLPRGEPVNFSNSALARYLSALFYQDYGNFDGARIEFEQLGYAFKENPRVYYHPMPSTAAYDQNVPSGKARLNIIGFTGLSPIKEERVFHQFFPVFNNSAFQNQVFRLPVFVKRPSRIDAVKVEVHENGSFVLELLEDIGEVVKETYNARFSEIFFKTYIRTILKYAAADIASTAIAERGGGLMGFAAAIAARVVVDISERADIRMGRYFPDKAYIGGVNLEPGTYDLTVTYYQMGKPIAYEEIVGINLRENRLNLVQVVCLK